MKSKNLILITVVTILSSVLLIALVGARGSFGFGKGSVIAFGEIEGQVNRSGEVILRVKKHPDASAMELYAVCQAPSGNRALATEPVIMDVTMRDRAGRNEIEQTNGAVIIAYGVLVADLNNRQRNSIDTSICPEPNSTIVETFPVGFEAVIRVKKNEDRVVNRVKYVCGTTLAQGGAIFADGDPMSGQNYICTDA